MSLLLLVAIATSTCIIPCVGESFTAKSLQYDPRQVPLPLPPQTPSHLAPSAASLWSTALSSTC